MKISKIIFISYFSVIVLFLLSLMIMGFAFNDAKYSRRNKITIETKTLELPHFQHVSIGENCRVSIQNAQESKLSYLNQKNAAVIEPIFKIENDTLFLISTKNNMQYNGVTLSSSYIQSITGKNCNISIKNMKQEFLYISTNGTIINIKNKVEIEKYELTLKQSSDFHCWNNFKGDELTIDLQNSKLRVRSQHKLSKIKGLATNHSYLELPAAKSYQLNVDENSQLRIY